MQFFSSARTGPISEPSLSVRQDFRCSPAHPENAALMHSSVQGSPLEKKTRCRCVLREHEKKHREFGCDAHEFSQCSVPVLNLVSALEICRGDHNVRGRVVLRLRKKNRLDFDGRRTRVNHCLCSKGLESKHAGEGGDQWRNSNHSR